MIPTEVANSRTHMYTCKRLGVDDFEFDYMATERHNLVESYMNETGLFLFLPKYEKVEFRCPVVRWKIEGQWFSAAIPLTVVQHEESTFTGYTKTWHMDHPAMEKTLMDMIEESRARVSK